MLLASKQTVLDLKATTLYATYKIKVKTIQADLSLMEDYKKVASETNNLEVRLFMPCAGIENYGVITTFPLEKELALIQLNITSTYILTQHYASKMMEQGKGGVLMVAILIVYMLNPYFSNYIGSKAYVVNFGTSIPWKMKKKGVDVTVLSPGVTNTPMSKREDIDWSKASFSIMSAKEAATLGLKELGKKALIILGVKNRIMMFITTRLSPLKMDIKIGSIITERIMPSALK